MARRVTQQRRTYELFWENLRGELRPNGDTSRAWTLAFKMGLKPGEPDQLIVEHETNTRPGLSIADIHNVLASVIKSHWPGSPPSAVRVHHVEVHELDLVRGGSRQITGNGKADLPARANIILMGVEPDALVALKRMGGARPKQGTILLHTHA